MKHYRFLALLLVALLLVATGCGGSRGVKAESPAEAVGMLIQRYFAAEDYGSICASSLSKAEVDAVLATINDAGGYYATTKNGSSLYEKIEGSAPSLGKNETCVGVYAGTSYESLSVQGYAIVALNAASGLYAVTQFVVQSIG